MHSFANPWKILSTRFIQRHYVKEKPSMALESKRLVLKNKSHSDAEDRAAGDVVLLAQGIDRRAGLLGYLGQRIPCPDNVDVLRTGRCFDRLSNRSLCLSNSIFGHTNRYLGSLFRL